MLRFIFLFLTFSAFVSCNKTENIVVTSKAREMDMYQIENNLNSTKDTTKWHGVYKGVLPCAQCTGIKTELVLFEDQSYKLTNTYLPKMRQADIQKGTFSWNNAGDIITLKNKMQYKIGEKKAWMLDLNGDIIVGPLAEKYILIKQ